MKIILADTNKIFGLFRAMILYNSDFSQSSFVSFVQNNTVYVSTYILNELYIVANINKILCNENDIASFVKQVGFKVYGSSKQPVDGYINYVLDDKDLQVLKDAVEINATHILTNNLKDFRIEEIKKDFGISIVNDLHNL